MSMVDVETKRIELRQKLSSIDDELTRWREDSERGKPLRKHHFQITRIADALGTYTTTVRGELDGLTASAPEALATIRRIELEILEVHRIWEFFRSKLVLRYVDWFKSYLDAADEFAWACYQPARDQVSPSIVSSQRVKEPPLVYFNGGWSPLTMSRGAGYAVEPVAGGALNSKVLMEYVKELPIPIIAVPWYQVRHFPDAAVIGHEVGHNVEDDMKLTSRLVQLIAKAGMAARIRDDRMAGWRRWSGEIFGDLYGMLATGPAFVSALQSFLEADPGIATTLQGRTKTDYLVHPPTGLRMLICFEALRQLGHAAESKAFHDGWVGRYPEHAMQHFETDIEAIVRALIEGPYPEFKDGGSITNVLRFGSGQQEEATDNVIRIDRGLGLKSVDIRVLVATARLAFDAAPAAFTTLDQEGKDANHTIVDRIVKLRDEEVRGGTNRPGATDAIDTELGSTLLASVRHGHEESMG